MHGRAQHEVPAFQRRLDRQADATRAHRAGLYRRAGLAQARRILDVGSGSGAVTADLADLGAAEVVAIDADLAMARRTHAAVAQARVLRADGRRLPFADGSFDAAVCNLVLLWTPEPAAVVAEMARVVRPGGVVLASMEPDYGGKVHYPENPLIDLVFQGEGVRRRGGDPHAGRKLRSHFVAAGLRTDVGIAPDVLTPDQDLQVFRRNRGYYRRLLAENGFAPAEVDRWEAEYMESLSSGQQLSFLPVFYALGRKPVPGDVDSA